jgi:hypothetical protein
VGLYQTFTHTSFRLQEWWSGRSTQQFILERRQKVRRHGTFSMSTEQLALVLLSIGIAWRRFRTTQFQFILTSRKGLLLDVSIAARQTLCPD